MALAEPEMQPRILRGLIAHATFSLIVKNQIAGSDFHASADGVSIRTRADEEKLQPVIGVASVVAQQLRSLPIVADEDVEVSIVVKVGDGSAPAHAREQKIRSQLVAHVLEYSMPGVPEHELGFRVGCIGVVALNVVQDVSIGYEQIARAIVVIVHKARTEPAQMKRVIRNP